MGLLPVPYFHVVFTLPHELSALVLGNKRLIYGLLYKASSDAMLRWHETQGILELISASSASCAPGDRPWNRTLTHDARHYHLLHFQ